jgi:CheY-like chemotaxis protein
MKPRKSISFNKLHRLIAILAMATAATIMLFEITPLSNPYVVESIMESQEQKTVFGSAISHQEEVLLTKTVDEHIIGNTYGTFASLLLQQEDWPSSSSGPAVNKKDSAQEDQEQQQEQQFTDKLSSIKAKKILIIDDEPSVTLTFKTVLQGSGFKDNVDVYNDPLEALSNFKPGFYDMLLLDVLMPKMNGFELYEKVRELDDTIKVCFMTSYDVYYMSLRELFPTVEVDSFIQKPIGADDLVNRIKQELQSI